MRFERYFGYLSERFDSSLVAAQRAVARLLSSQKLKAHGHGADS